MFVLQILNLAQALRDSKSPLQLVQMPVVTVERRKKTYGRSRVRADSDDTLTQRFSTRSPFFSWCWSLIWLCRSSHLLSPPILETASSSLNWNFLLPFLLLFHHHSFFLLLAFLPVAQPLAYSCENIEGQPKYWWGAKDSNSWWNHRCFSIIGEHVPRFPPPLKSMPMHLTNHSTSFYLQVFWSCHYYLIYFPFVYRPCSACCFLWSHSHFPLLNPMYLSCGRLPHDVFYHLCVIFNVVCN